MGAMQAAATGPGAGMPDKESGSVPQRAVDSAQDMLDKMKQAYKGIPESVEADTLLSIWNRPTSLICISVIS